MKRRRQPDRRIGAGFEHMYCPCVCLFDGIPIGIYFTAVFVKIGIAFYKNDDLKKAAMAVNAYAVILGWHHFDTVIRRSVPRYGFCHISFITRKRRVRNRR